MRTNNNGGCRVLHHSVVPTTAALLIFGFLLRPVLGFVHTTLSYRIVQYCMVYEKR